jgi:hypothetical protein
MDRQRLSLRSSRGFVKHAVVPLIAMLARVNGATLRHEQDMRSSVISMFELFGFGGCL